MNLTPVNELLIDMDKTQIEFAEELGVDRRHLCKVINGHRRSARVRRKISLYFNRPVRELFPETADPVTTKNTKNANGENQIPPAPFVEGGAGQNKRGPRTSA